MLPFFRGGNGGPHRKGLGGRPGALCRVDSSVGRGLPQAMTPPGNGRAPAHLVRQGWATSNGPTQSGCSANICQGDKNFIIPVIWCGKFLPAVPGGPGLCGEWLIIPAFRLARGRGRAGLASSVKLNPSSENPGRHGSTSSLSPLGSAPLNLSRPMRTFPGRKCPGSAWAPCWG